MVFVEFEGGWRESRKISVSNKNMRGSAAPSCLKDFTVVDTSESVSTTPIHCTMTRIDGIIILDSNGRV